MRLQSAFRIIRDHHINHARIITAGYLARFMKRIFSIGIHEGQSDNPAIKLMMLRRKIGCF